MDCVPFERPNYAMSLSAKAEKPVSTVDEGIERSSTKQGEAVTVGNPSHMVLVNCKKPSVRRVARVAARIVRKHPQKP